MRGRPSVLEVCAWVFGLLCISTLLFIQIQAGGAAHAAARFRETEHRRQQDASGSEGATHPSRDYASYQGVIGRLEIHALDLTVPILNNYDPNSLRRGVGRIRGTGVPGGLGNFVVAGHRDTYFRPLRHVQKGMVMHVVSDTGTFDYVIDSTSIVTPDDVDVLDIRDRPEMTLITCYPFNYVGAAPKRFIVRGYLVSLATP